MFSVVPTICHLNQVPVDHHGDLCYFGITSAAQTTISVVTVFLPCVVLLFVTVFVFVAVFSDLPAANTNTTPTSHSNNSDLNLEDAAVTSRDRSSIVSLLSPTNDRRGSAQRDNTGKLRRLLVALLLVNGATIIMSLPYTTHTHIRKECYTAKQCLEMVVLFQALSWLRSSVMIVRPLVFCCLIGVMCHPLRSRTRLSESRELRSFPRKSYKSQKTADNNGASSSKMCHLTSRTTLREFTSNVSYRTDMTSVDELSREDDETISEL